MKNGVPFDVAMNLPDDERTAWCIIYGEMDGGHLDWSNGRWKERT